MRREKVFSNKTSHAATRKRLALISLFFLLGFGVIIFRAYSLQVAPRQDIDRLAQSQHKKRLPDQFGRGHIYDRNGNELAISVPSYSLVGHPHLIEEPKNKARALFAALNVDPKDLVARMSRDSKFVWLKRHLPETETEKIRPLMSEGLSLVKESQRFYPNRLLAASVLGAVGYDDRGLSGLELHYNEQLRGATVRKVAYRDARGEIYETGETLAIPDRRERPASNLILTLDRQIQFVAEKELAAAVDQYHANWGTIVVMQPHSGAILAMASYPSFNPNEYAKYDQSLWKNKATATLVEPGSTFKIVTAAAALESGKVKPEDLFNCENGKLMVSGKWVRDHDPYKILSFSDVIKFSSNIGVYKISEKVGAKDFYHMIEKFGFGKKTGVDYPGEINGQLRPLAKWYKIDQAAISFGQGIGVSPLQMTTAMATIASGGLRFRPYLVHHVVDEQGDILSENKPHLVERVISQQTASKLSTMLKAVVMDGGTGTAAAIPGYSVAGKTGTAQKIDPQTRSYSNSKYFSSFVGFAPADNPQLVIFVGIDEPKGLTYGGQVAAPVFSKVGLAALQQLGVAPDRPLLVETKHQTPKSSVKMAALGSVSETNNQKQAAGLMPNLLGLSMREAATLLGQVCGSSRIRGSGFVVTQEPRAGSPLGKETLCRVELEPLQ